MCLCDYSKEIDSKLTYNYEYIINISKHPCFYKYKTINESKKAIQLFKLLKF